MRIDTPYAKALVKNYAQNHWPVINGACPSLHQNPMFPAVQDSRSVWFSLDDLQNFINEFSGPGNTEGLGVRIYFGEYDAGTLNADPLNEGPETTAYTGLHTLIMLPTMLGEDGYNHDFDPQYADAQQPFQTPDICALNHGTLMPPPFKIIVNTTPGSQNQQQVNVGQDFMIFCDENP